MEELQKQVRRAQWRMGLQRLAGVFAWCWSGTLVVVLVLIALGKYYSLGVPVWVWGAGALQFRLLTALAWMVGALALALVMALAWMAATRREALGAAIEIDRRYKLKERVSSTLALHAEDRDTPLGRALVDDAVGRVERIDVGEHFPVVPGKSLLLPLLPAVLAVLVVVFASSVVDNPAKATPDTLAVTKQVKKSTNDLRRKLAERRKQAENMGLKDAEKLFKKLEQGTQDLAAGKTKRKDAMVKLNDLARELKKRRQELGGADKVKQQLNQLNKINQGPADKFAKAISKGDFQKAIDELQKMKNQIQNSDLNDEQKQALADQFDQIKDKLDKLAEAHKGAVADLKQRANQAKAAGDAREASKLEEQLQQLLQQAPQMQQMQDLAKQMGNCSKCLKQGQLQDAADALDQLQAGLGDLQQQLDEMEMLDGAMDQLCQARDQMNCPGCKGAGCAMCGGQGKGDGMGEGQGQGARPEAETDNKFYDSQVRQKVGQGAGVITDLVDGPNVRGDAEEAIEQQIDSARQGSTDPLSGRRMPRNYNEHAQEYLDRWREGE